MAFGLGDALEFRGEENILLSPRDRVERRSTEIPFFRKNVSTRFGGGRATVRGIASRRYRALTSHQVTVTTSTPARPIAAPTRRWDMPAFGSAASAQRPKLRPAGGGEAALSPGPPQARAASGSSCPVKGGRAGLRICRRRGSRPDFGRCDAAPRKLFVMSVSDRATTASTGKAHSILFGLLADGSGNARFRSLDGRRPAAGPEPSSGGFSPSDDWYGRWAVQPLHGVLAPLAGSADGVCPHDIVVLTSERPRRA